MKPDSQADSGEDQGPPNLGANDRAFIKVAKEFRMLQEGIRIQEALVSLLPVIDAGASALRQNLYNSSGSYHHVYSGYSEPTAIAQNVQDIINCPESMRGYLEFMKLLVGDRQRMPDLLKKSKERLEELKGMLDAYCMGGDILMLKLSREVTSE